MSRNAIAFMNQLLAIMLTACVCLFSSSQDYAQLIVAMNAAIQASAKNSTSEVANIAHTLGTLQLARIGVIMSGALCVILFLPSTFFCLRITNATTLKRKKSVLQIGSAEF